MERGRSQDVDVSMALGDQSELMRSAELSLHPSLHSISHEMPLDLTRSSDEGSLTGRSEFWLKLNLISVGFLLGQ